MNMAEKIRLYRKRENLTQEKLAELIGVSVMTIKRWEWNERTPNASLIPKLAEALNTTAGYLLGETEEPGENENQKSEHIYKKEAEEKKEAEDDLDLGYWGAMVEKASRAAHSGNEAKKSAVAMMLNMAVNAFKTEQTTGGVIPQAVGFQGNNNQVANNYVNA